ncbi:Zn(II)2Cys6 transcription factor protein [Rutstroemia sp. NJR-2017a BBW]|nr:Zn(II)2Cys6 transcription factor protein [Rutstroemia sp. NJR-2017a BBW]
MVASKTTFKMVKNTGTSRKRSRFDPKRRQEVTAVRRKRACLRCSLLKIKCSDDDLCTTCEKLSFALHEHEKQILSFSGCIRTRIPEVSVFEACECPFTHIPFHNLRDLVTAKNAKLEPITVSHDFASHVVWDLKALVEDIVDWLNDPMISHTSKVGILSSPQFLELIGPFIEEKSKAYFQRMIYFITLAYTQKHAPDRQRQRICILSQIGSITGHEFLKVLDEKLKPQSLKDCTKDDLYALFLLVVGTILAVGYTEPDAEYCFSQNREASSPTQGRSGEFQAMRDFLCQILAHYMVYLGSQLSLHVAGHVEILILQAAPIRWHKKGSFGWETRLNNSGVAGSSSGTEVDFILDNAYLRGDCSDTILQQPMWDTEKDSQPLQILGSDPVFPNNFSDIAFAMTDLPSDPQISSNISGASAILGSQLQQPQPQFNVSLPYSDGPSTASNEQSISGCLLAGAGCAYTVIGPPLEQSIEPRIHPSTVETELPKESDEEPRGNGHKEGKATEQPTLVDMLLL